MNDHELQQRVQAAFDSIEMPAGMKQKTLEQVLVRTQAHDGAEAAAAPRPAGRWRIRRAAPQRRGMMAIFGGAAAACLAFALVLTGVAQVDEGLVVSAPGGEEQIGAAQSIDPADLEPTAFVDIDINPSVQLKLNRSDQVVGAEGINEDGSSLLAGIPVDGLPYEEALRALTASEALAPYLDDDAFITVSISSQDRSQERALTAVSEEYLASAPYQGSCHGVSPQLYEEAHSHGMGCGRYAAAVELSRLDPSLSVEDCSAMTMRELRDRIAALEGSGDSAAAEPSSGGGGGCGMGHGQGRHHGWR